MNIKDYIKKSKEGAETAFYSAGLKHRPQIKVAEFEAHFGFKPRPLQQTICDLKFSNAPGLTIAEAPTGEGKTEGAFYLAGRRGKGIYVAMPSMSTSNGIYPRLKKFLAGDPENKTLGAHGGDNAAVRLVHGNDLLHDDAVALLAVNDSLNDIDANTKGNYNDKTLNWFMPRKRGLLVPYGVGTVDQAFLGALHARHFFLRLFALSGKTVIFDEVHAYDTYMNTIFERLLMWLKALDVNVIVLSATLPTQTRVNMLKAWGVEAPPDIKGAAYPVVWHAENKEVKEIPFDPTKGRGQKIIFQWCNSEPREIARQAEDMIKRGACVFVVCNTVDRAEEVFSYLDREDLLPADDRMLLHARMPMYMRQKREERALIRFGKGRKSGAGLLVGTQVIEQSLDIDADAMITDLAPIDLILQRAGRLHRHDRNRPPGFENPVLILGCNEYGSNTLPEIDSITGFGKVYDKSLVWKTWSVIREKKGWSLPQGDGHFPGYRILIESVYDNLQEIPSWLNHHDKQNYQEELNKWNDVNKSLSNEAGLRIIPPDKKLKELFTHQKGELIEEDEAHDGNVPRFLRAATRNPEGESIDVLLLYPLSEGWGTRPGGDADIKYDANQRLTTDSLKMIFGAAVRISKKKVVQFVKNNPYPKWQAVVEKHQVLKRFHIVQLNNGEALMDGIKLRLDERLGVVYEKVKK